MVHLGVVQNDKQLSDKNDATVAIQELDIDDDSLAIAGKEEYSSSVYGTRFADTDLPKHEMPEGEMPREVAYRMIK